MLPPPQRISYVCEQKYSAGRCTSKAVEVVATPLSWPPLWKAIKKFAPLLVALERDDFTLQKNILMQATTIIWGGIIPPLTVHRLTMAKITYKQYLEH